MIPLLDILTPVIGKILDFIPDPQKKAEAQLKLTEEINRNSEAIMNALSQVDVAQAKINEADAQSPDKFKSWPRPAAMWISVIGLAWTVIPVIVGQFFVWFGRPAPVVVELPSFVINTLLYGLLGLGAYRTYEKKQGLTQ